MRTALTIVFMIMSVGGVLNIFDTDDPTERRVYALAALIGAIATLARFIVLTIALPVVVFWLATGHHRPSGEGEALLAAVLAAAGLGTWGWLYWRD